HPEGVYRRRMKQRPTLLPLAESLPRTNPGKLAVLSWPVFRLSVPGHHGEEKPRVKTARLKLRSNPAAGRAKDGFAEPQAMLPQGVADLGAAVHQGPPHFGAGLLRNRGCAIREQDAGFLEELPSRGHPQGCVETAGAEHRHVLVFAFAAAPWKSI